MSAPIFPKSTELTTQSLDFMLIGALPLVSLRVVPRVLVD